MTRAEFFRSGRYRLWAWIAGARLLVALIAAALFGFGYFIVLYPEGVLLWGINRLLHGLVAAVWLPPSPFSDYTAALFIPLVIADTLAVGYWIERRKASRG